MLLLVVVALTCLNWLKLCSLARSTQLLVVVAVARLVTVVVVK